MPNNVKVSYNGVRNFIMNPSNEIKIGQYGVELRTINLDRTSKMKPYDYATFGNSINDNVMGVELSKKLGGNLNTLKRINSFNNYIEMTCPYCHRTYEMRLDHALKDGNICCKNDAEKRIYCYRQSTSYEELFIKNALIKIYGDKDVSKVKLKRNYRYAGKYMKLDYDIAILSKRVFIEHSSTLGHNSDDNHPLRDRARRAYAKENGYQLIEVWKKSYKESKYNAITKLNPIVYTGEMYIRDLQLKWAVKNILIRIGDGYKFNSLNFLDIREEALKEYHDVKTEERIELI